MAAHLSAASDMDDEVATLTDNIKEKEEELRQVKTDIKTITTGDHAAVEALVKKLPGSAEMYPKQGLLDILKKNGRGANTAVKPQKPPKPPKLVS